MSLNKKQLGKDTRDAKRTIRKQDGFSKDVIVDPKGQWAHPGEITRIPGNQITMRGVPYPVLGIDDQGNEQMMFPGQDYLFPGNYVTEYPYMNGFGLNRPPHKGAPAFIPFPNKLSGNRPFPFDTGFDKLPTFNPNYNDSHDRRFDWHPGYENTGVAFQQGGEFFETELDENQIAYYRSLGYRVEEIE